MLGQKFEYRFGRWPGAIVATVEKVDGDVITLREPAPQGHRWLTSPATIGTYWAPFEGAK